MLYSGDQAVTLVVQDEFVPFSGDDFKIPAFRLHDLPWPAAVLEDLDSAAVTLRVTLSYFIEPTASRRGWRQRYRYASHALRFEIQDPLESENDFVQRVTATHEPRSPAADQPPARSSGSSEPTSATSAPYTKTNGPPTASALAIRTARDLPRWRMVEEQPSAGTHRPTRPLRPRCLAQN